MSNAPQAYSVPQAALELGISSPTLYRWIDRGYINVSRTIAGRLRISVAELDRIRAVENGLPWKQS